MVPPRISRTSPASLKRSTGAADLRESRMQMLLRPRRDGDSGYRKAAVILSDVGAFGYVRSMRQLVSQG